MNLHWYKMLTIIVLWSHLKEIAILMVNHSLLTINIGCKGSGSWI